MSVLNLHRIEVDRTNDGVAIIAVEGEHDISTVPSLRDELGAVIRKGTPLVIDLTGATFLDSSVLRALLEARQQAEKQNLGFAVALDSSEAPGVKRVLEITGLMSVFPVLPARERAIETARSRHMHK